MNKKRLEKFRDFLRNDVPRRKFNIGCETNLSKDDLDGKRPNAKTPYECGFAGCAVGWLPACFPRLCKYVIADDCGDIEVQSVDGYEGPEILQHLFGITSAQAWAIYMPDSYKEYMEKGVEGVTPKTVARRIDRILKGDSCADIM